jgi:signal transduction histidine kinase
MGERVEMAGGRCVVFSRPGEGVTVRVTFPTRVAAPRPPVAGADGR